MKLSATIMLTAALASICACAFAAVPAPTDSEMRGISDWFSAKFLGKKAEVVSGTSTVTILESGGPVLMNKGYDGGKLLIGGSSFDKGICCVAPCKLLVKLPGPGSMFSAICGADNDSVTAANKTSMKYRVIVNGETKYESKVMNWATPGEFPKFDLDGATEFILEVDPLDDGNTCDIADWAEAAVILKDGRQQFISGYDVVGGSAGDIGTAFSFKYDGKVFDPKAWNETRSSRRLDEDRTKHTLLYTSPDGLLEVECDALEYKNYPALEWILNFRNVGGKNTAQISDIHAMDASFNTYSKTTVYHAGGGGNLEDDFGITADVMDAGSDLKFGSRGMSSVTALPFFTMDNGDDGIVAAVGWSGNWDAVFAKTASKVNVTAGMPNTDMYLAPGESVRSPRMLILRYEGDRFRGQNMWRRMIMKYYSPKDAEGNMLRGPVTDGNWGSFPASEQLGKIDWWVKNDLNLEVYWIDAGWSGVTGPMEMWPENAANRVVNPDLYPKGMKEVSDYAHKNGMKFLLWTWPHRALPGVEIGKEHPEWLVNNEALDHGDPVVNDWMKRYFSDMVKKNGMDWYRQDGHPIIPADKPGKTGYNEIKYFEGMYDYWDYLLKDNPGLGIDNCAGGGRKIDLETGMRSISLWRSDYQVPNDFDPIGMQGQTYGLSNWVPLSGACSARTDAYGMRSGYSPALCINWHVYQHDIEKESPNFDYASAKKYLKEYYDVRDYFYGDYYPLTDYNVDHTLWIAYQFDCPESGTGLVQAFRREKSDYTAMTLLLKGLDEESVYEIRNFDLKKPVRMTGRALMIKGITVNINAKPGAAVLTYKKIK